MGERTSGIWHVLSPAKAYSALQRLLGGGEAMGALVGEHIRARRGDRIIDLGCGPARVLSHLPDVDYWGFDHSAAYIDAARKRHGPRGRFFAQDASSLGDDLAGSADIVLALGLLHHVDDAAARKVFAYARRVLKPGGRMITIDGVHRPEASRIERLLLDLDRGRNVRDARGYEALARDAFTTVKAVVRTDLLRVPYAHMILECTAT